MPRLPFLRVSEFALLDAGALGQGIPRVSISVKPFGALVAMGVIVGAWLAIRQAARLGLSERVLGTLVLWVVASGFVGGHVLDALFYCPERVWEEPWSLLLLWDGQSSFGGFAGALLGAYGFAKRYRMAILPYLDVIASALPMGWVLGRLGCSLVHDHPGRASELWLATAYPGGGRVDLGFWEMAMSLPLAVTFLLLRRRPRPPGFYLATLTLAYAPIRCGLDFLRATEVSWPDVPVVDPRYGPFTPAQWGCLLLLGAGVWLFWRLARSIASPTWVTSAMSPPTTLVVQCG